MLEIVDENGMTVATGVQDSPQLTVFGPYYVVRPIDPEFTIDDDGRIEIDCVAEVERILAILHRPPELLPGINDGGIAIDHTNPHSIMQLLDQGKLLLAKEALRRAPETVRRRLVRRAVAFKMTGGTAMVDGLQDYGRGANVRLVSLIERFPRGRWEPGAYE